MLRVAPELLPDQLLAPEAEGDVLLESRHAGHDSRVLEMGHAPLDGLGDLRVGLVHERAQVAQDGLREVR
jgi:hypothetical protein